MAKFKCVSGGEIYEFTMEHDIKAMRLHPEYVEIADTEEPVKKSGRPKQVNTTDKETEGA